MSYNGTVKNGVIVLDPGVTLPEGIAVRVDTELLPKDMGTDLDPAFRIGELAVDCGIPDLSVNLDHYLYGHPVMSDHGIIDAFTTDHHFEQAGFNCLLPEAPT